MGTWVLINGIWYKPANKRPTAVDPVKLIFFMIGELIRCFETSEGSPNTTFKTPAGSPASCAACAIAIAVAGVSSAGLMMQEQPAANAVEIFRAGIFAGKFHGVKAATGPTGSCKTVKREEYDAALFKLPFCV